MRAHGVEPKIEVPVDLRVDMKVLLDTWGLKMIGEALKEYASPAEARQQGPLGNIFLRPMHFPGVGSTIVGHLHFYDHVTFISSGSLLCKYKYPDGRTKEEILIAPAVLLVDKDTWHEFTALEDNTEACCIFSLREKDGKVVEEWNENFEATQARL